MTVPFVTATTYVQAEVAPLKKLWGTWLQEKSLMMVYATRGIGKSYFVQRLAFTLAAGESFLKFKTEKCKVALIDGELPFEDLHERFKQIIREIGSSESLDNVKVLTRRELGYEWNLGRKENQLQLWRAIKDCDVIILDNLMTLAPIVDGRDSDVSQWQRIQGFLIGIRDIGKSVIIVHHSGKSGEQHGTSQRENIMDTIIALYQLPQQASGLRFELKFTKTRRFFGKDAEPLCLSMETKLDGRTSWHWDSMEDYKRRQIVTLQDAGLSKKQIQEELRISTLEYSKLTQAVPLDVYDEELNDPF